MVSFRRGKKTRVSDLELIRRYKDSGDQISVSELFERYSPQVFGNCLKILKNIEDAKDAAQEIFAKVYEKLLDTEIANFRNWLYTVTLNHCRNKLRQRSRERIIFIDDGELEKMLWNFGQNQCLNSSDEQKELNQRLQKALSQLSEPQRICIERFYFEEQSYKDIAAESVYTWKQVKSNIENGRRNLRNYFNAMKD